MQYEIEIQAKEYILTGNLFTPKKRTKTGIILAHGWTSSNKKLIKLAEELAQKGLLALAINLRGHGNSPYSLDNLSRADHLEDLLTAIDYLKTEYKVKEIVLLGKSYSGYLAAIASSLREVNYLILSQPALYPDADFELPTKALLQEDPSLYRQTGEKAENNKALKAIEEYTQPILLIESQKDKEIPAEVTLQFKEIVGQKKNSLTYVLHQADHSLSRPEYLSDFYRRISKWLRRFGILS